MPIVKDEENHLYYDGQIRIPSVTEVLEVMGISDYSNLPEDDATHYKHRGTFVHAAVNQIVRGKFNPKTHDRFPLFSGYIRAFERFKAERLFHPRNSEIVLYNADYGIAGTMDLDGAFDGDSFWTEIEVKTGRTPKWARLQAAAYRMMFNYSQPLGSPAIIKCHRVLTLKKDGSYTLSRKQLEPEFNEQLADFLVLLTAYKARQRWRDNH